MKVHVEYASDSGMTPKTVELDNTIDALLNFMKQEGKDLIIQQATKDGCDFCILVYDDYVE